jgi:hypothetical protein
MPTWLEDINVLELSAVRRPANKKRKLHQKAVWSTAFINDLPDTAFLYIAPGGQKDDEGKTTPRSLRYFPVRGADGKLDAAHVRNALSRIPQAKLPASVKETAAGKARRLLEQITKSEDDDMPHQWIPEETLKEFIEKASISDAQKAAIKAAVGALNKAGGGDMDEDGFGKLKATIAKLLGYGKTEKSVEDAVAEAKKSAEDAKAKVVEVAKSALDVLQADKPAINEALTILGELAEVKPVLKMEGLPPEARAQVEAMQKAAEEDRKKLVELQKSIDDQAAKATELEFITKATSELPNVPMESNALGKLLHAVAKTEDGDAIASLDKLLKSVEEIAKQSDLFVEKGGSGEVKVGKDAGMAKIDALAEQAMQKSEKQLTHAQAVAHVLEQNPALYDEYNKQA